MWIKTLFEATRERKLGRNSLTSKETLKKNHVGGLKMWHTSKNRAKIHQNRQIPPESPNHSSLIAPQTAHFTTTSLYCNICLSLEQKKRLHFHQHPHHTLHFWLFFTLFCAAFRYCFNLSAVPNVSKHIAFLKFTSFMRLGCSSATSNAVYCSARGLLYFEWSKHEMMIAGGCAVNLNWDVCRYILTYPLLYLCTESECPLQVNPIESHPHKSKSRFVVLHIAVFAVLCASFALGYRCINIYSTLRLIL